MINIEADSKAWAMSHGAYKVGSRVSNGTHGGHVLRWDRTMVRVVWDDDSQSSHRLAYGLRPVR
jgi:hypothetical protein